MYGGGFQKVVFFLGNGGRYLYVLPQPNNSVIIRYLIHKVNQGNDKFQIRTITLIFSSQKSIMILILGLKKLKKWVKFG